MFHRIGDDRYMVPAGLRPSGEQKSIERFRRVLSKIRDEHTVVPLHFAARAIKGDFDLPSNTAVLTFDDGTRDHVEVVLPILQEFGFTATFFVMTGVLADNPHCAIPDTFKMQLLTGDPKWVEEEGVGLFLRTMTELDQSFVDWWQKGVEVPDERFIGEPSQTIRKLKWMINYHMDATLRSMLMNTMFTIRFPGESEKDIACKMFLQGSDIARLHAADMDIGFHTISHRTLTKIKGNGEVYAEIVGGRTILTQYMGGKQPDIFAYPGGGPSTFDATHTETVQAHYDCAVSTGNQKTWCTTEDSAWEMPRVHEANFLVE